MHVFAAGHGSPALVFIHGVTCDHTDWLPLIERLSPRHACIAVDLPGHGQSDAAAEDCTIISYGKSVADHVVERDLGDVVLIGHSMGCRVTIEAASRITDRIRGLVLLDGSRFAPEIRDTVEDAITNGRYRAMIDAMFAQMFTEKSDLSAAAAIRDRAANMREDCGHEIMRDVIGYDNGEINVALSACANAGFPVCAIQATVTAPDRTRRAIRSDETATPYTDWISQSVPNTSVRLIADCGHFPQIDRPDETTEMIADFLATLE